MRETEFDILIWCTSCWRESSKMLCILATGRRDLTILDNTKQIHYKRSSFDLYAILAFSASAALSTSHAQEEDLVHRTRLFPLPPVNSILLPLSLRNDPWALG